MLKAKDFRQRAWEHLGGNWIGNIWGIFALVTLLYLAINGVCVGMVIGWVAIIVISGPLLLGLAIISTNVVRGEGIRIENLFDGFKNMSTAIVLWLLNGIFIFLWSLLLYIPGIIKYYSYSMSFFILRDNPNMSQDEARRASMAMMHGNKWRLFCLDFSFIGWMILNGLTMGLITFWVFPYMQTAHAEFYQSLLAEAGIANSAPKIDSTDDSELL